MSMTRTDMITNTSASYAGFADAIGGIATVVLAIVGLTGFAANMMLGIATLIFAVALVIEGEAIITEYGRIVFPAGTAAAPVDQYGGGGLSAILLAGAAGIVLGVLALLGIHPIELTSVAVIAFGGALVLGCNAVSNLRFLKIEAERSTTSSPRYGSEILAAEMASGSSGIQAIVGFAAIVLGILAVVGMNAVVLGLVALLALGATLVMTGTALSGVLLSIARPATTSQA